MNNRYMKEAKFNKIFKEIINNIAETVENNDANGEIDVDINADILSIENNHGIYIINKQPSIQEIWLSSPVSGPYHFSFIDGKWQNKDEKNLFDLLEQELGFNFKK